MNTTPLTDHQLDEIAGRAAGLYEYATGLDTAWQDEADQLAGTDVPALLAEIRRLRTEQQDENPDFTEARAAFMQLGRTPSLEGLRAELRIEGWPPLIGRYTGASMGRMHDVPGYEHLLAVDPRLIFEYADAEPPA